jgi:hypothetical protein
MDRPKVCPECKGSMMKKWCPKCQGTGEVDRPDKGDGIKKILRLPISFDVETITDGLSEWNTYTGQMQESFVSEITKRIKALFDEKEIRKQVRDEWRQKCADMVAARHEISTREEMERIHKWGDESCSCVPPVASPYSLMKSSLFKRQCNLCWQALKKG